MLTAYSVPQGILRLAQTEIGVLLSRIEFLHEPLSPMPMQMTADVVGPAAVVADLYDRGASPSGVEAKFESNATRDFVTWAGKFVMTAVGSACSTQGMTVLQATKFELFATEQPTDLLLRQLQEARKSEDLSSKPAPSAVAACERIYAATQDQVGCLGLRVLGVPECVRGYLVENAGLTVAQADRLARKLACQASLPLNAWEGESIA